MLTVAAERFIPLTSVFEAFARECRWPLARGCRRMVGMLKDGMSLPDALERCRRLLPPNVLPMIRVGYESGALAPALRQAASHRDLEGPLWASLASRALYLFIALCFGVATVTFMMLTTVPQFIKIFDDYDFELPMMTRLVIAAANLFGSFWWLLAPIYLALGLLFFYALLRYIGWIRWELPGTRRLVRRLHTAAILDTLALATERGRPLLDSIATLANSYPHAWIRRRLQRVAYDVYAGENWCRSLFRRGLLGRADLAVLQAAGRVGNLPWAMKEMADSGRRRVAYRLHALVQLLFPAVILGMAVFVMFYMVAMFMPLVSLITKCTL